MTVAVLGEALIDMIADGAGSYSAHLGGSPFNVAIALARQGTNVCYLSPLSDDNFGDQLQRALSEEKVATPVKRRSRWPTSIAMVTIDAQGQASYRLYREGVADKDTSVEEVIENLPDDITLFHSGSLALTPSQLPRIKGIFSYLRERGVPISIDLNIRERASYDLEKYLQGVRSLLPLVDIVKASDEDLDVFALSDDPQTTGKRFHQEMEGGLLVLTRGQHGASVFSGSDVITAPAYPVTTLADTVGAGDTFHAAFLSSLLLQGALSSGAKDWDSAGLVEAINFAGAAAAINVSREGCSPPTRDEVVDLLGRTHP